ncbi:hypothetical protein [Pseudobacillus badius]|uniref:hypothetical protein n=1 Tax=Bacillus badius TaxID=1455 RepID=UPI0007B06D25|nr:hypothetical protein [Bacillus badius]KZO01185.1 hypothetical protein A4244_13020 [Bacillus badius]OCS89364.1 hypothetical protein A6M11_13035 [Bacillus badius]OVE51257.1 hypothetical protein B1A98_12835 [Bacillus badius]TDW02252.1 hypothetical protein B0G66_10783 [Bacillus badius]
MSKERKENLADGIDPALKARIDKETAGLRFTKNFRSATAEEWYLFFPGFTGEPAGSAAGKAIIHYELYGNREIFIHTTIIYSDPRMEEPAMYPLIYALSDEIINRLVGYADTLLSVYAGPNSYQAEYRSPE